MKGPKLLGRGDWPGPTGALSEQGPHRTPVLEQPDWTVPGWDWGEGLAAILHTVPSAQDCENGGKIGENPCIYWVFSIL